VNSESKLSSVGIIGDSPVMHLLARQIETAAGCDLTAVVTGESGTGKELVARATSTKRPRRHAIHFRSLRRHYRNFDGVRTIWV
jgi:transcriptional regulator with GAF, ATPase, and Fis domain